MTQLDITHTHNYNDMKKNGNLNTLMEWGWKVKSLNRECTLNRKCCLIEKTCCNGRARTETYKNKRI